MLHIHRLPIIFTIVCTCLFACAAPTEISIPSPTITATQLPTVSPTETLVPTPTPEPTATETLIPQPETDLEPSFVNAVDTVFMGVAVKSDLITDSSLAPSINKVTVSEKTWAEFITRSIYEVWEASHKGVTYEDYMQMVAEVQAGARDPLEIAFTAYANDMNDGVPYQKDDGSVNTEAQKKYIFVPWYEGEVVGQVDEVEVRTLSQINVALVKPKKVDNITIFDNNAYGFGRGTNISGNVMVVYTGSNSTTGPTGRIVLPEIAWFIDSTSSWLKTNEGNTVSGYGNYKEILYELLKISLTLN